MKFEKKFNGAKMNKQHICDSAGVAANKKYIFKISYFSMISESDV